MRISSPPMRYPCFMGVDIGSTKELIAANRSVELIAAELDRPLPSDLQHHFRRTREAVEQLWDEDTGQYYSRDAVTREFLHEQI